MPDASPVKWHLAHTSWFFETFLLERFAARLRAVRPAFRVLFNSYYDAVGDQHPRPQRGLLSRPDLADACAHIARTSTRAMRAAPRATAARRGVQRSSTLGLHHEQQHQELILTDVKHLLSRNPAAARCIAPAGRSAQVRPQPLAWHRVTTAALVEHRPRR